MVVVSLLGVGLSAGLKANEPAGGAVPAFRKAERVAIIPIRGAINAVTSLSVKRRIAEAERGGAGAMVFEIDSPGGELGAVLEITNQIKGSSIVNTVAWIHPDAYSGGAIIALACREIVASDPASMGDAFVVTPTSTGIRGLSEDERTKILPVLLADVTESARRNGHDEYLAQAMVADGIELWAVRDTRSGRWHFINEVEYRAVIGGEPPRERPLLATVPGGREATKRAREAAGSDGRGGAAPDSDEDTPGTEAPGTGAGPGADGADRDDGADDDGGSSPATPSPISPPRPNQHEAASPPTAAPSGAPGASTAPTGFRPASPSLADLSEAVNDGLTLVTERPAFSEADRGLYADAVYVSDGTAAVVLRQDQLERFGVSAARVTTDEELRAFFGAVTMSRSEQNWSEHLVAVITNPWIKGLLIVLFLVGLFVEMLNPGMILPGAVAICALGALVVGPALIGLAGWWEVASIVAGVGLIAVEVFFVPGVGVFGVLGLIALFVGLIGTFIPDGDGVFSPAASGAAVTAAATVLLAMFSSGVVLFFIARNVGSVPLFNRLILTDRPDDDDEPGGTSHASEILAAAAPLKPQGPEVGDLGLALTPLRPSGIVRVNGGALDAIARRGVIDAGSPVRIVGRRGFSVLVEPAGPMEPSASEPEEDADGPGIERTGVERAGAEGSRFEVLDADDMDPRRHAGEEPGGDVGR